MRPTAKTLVFLFALTFWSFTWFAGEFWNWNSTSRLFSTISYLDTGQTSIDAYSEYTGDIAFHNGHYYSDKAPGMSLLALPSVAAIKSAAKLAGIDLAILDSTGQMRQAPYGALALAATATTSSLLSALACLTMLLVLSHMTGGLRSSLTAVLVVWMGTPLWGWSGCFFGHAAAAALLTFGFASLYLMNRVLKEFRHRALAASLGSMCLTFAIVVEHTAAPPSLLIFLWTLWESRKWRGKELGSLILLGLGGACLSASPLFFYNMKTFGKPLATGYQHLVGFEGMQEGFMGLTYPKIQVVYQLLLGAAPGLLIIAPVLLFVPYGWVLCGREAPSTTVLSASLFLYYLLLNASYHYWGGNWSTGPRHMTASLPFLALPLAYLYRDLKGRWLGILYLVSVVSVFFSLASAAVGMTPPPVDGHPFYKGVLSRFFSGDFTTPLGVFLNWSGPGLLTAYFVVAVPLFLLLKRSVETLRDGSVYEITTSEPGNPPDSRSESEKR